MPRNNRKVSPRALDQADWEVCIAWRRMFVACSNAGGDLRVPITNFLLESRPIVKEVGDSARRDRADGVLRGAWEHLHEDFEWAACVYGISARSIATDNEEPDGHELLGWDLCRTIRERHPKAPTGFEKIGRTANRDD